MRDRKEKARVMVMVKGRVRVIGRGNNMRVEVKAMEKRDKSRVEGQDEKRWKSRIKTHDE